MKKSTIHEKGQIEWIDLSHAPLGSRETRARVRSHVMKATGASRRKSATWGKRNLLQLPDNLITHDGGQHVVSSPSPNGRTDVHSRAITSLAKVAPTISKSRSELPAVPGIGPAMPLAGLELLAAEAGVHILDLSALTDIQCGWTACAILASKSGKSTPINGLVSRRQPSYLYSVARRYGSSPCLDAALRCVAIRARRVLVPSQHQVDKLEYLHHVTALQAIQKAVDDENDRGRPEVLGAINLLSLFELLEYTHEQAWSLHIVGASRLVRARGPASFVSDFDIRLLLSMVTAMTHESMRSGEPCFLEEAPWQQRLQSSIIKSNMISSRSAIAISLLCIMVRGPRLMRDVCHVFKAHEGAKRPDLSKLKKQLREYRGELLKWHAEFDSALSTLPLYEGAQTPNEDIRTELLASCYGLIIACSRMMSAISVDLIDILEDEAVAYATEMVKLETDISSVNKSASFYIRQKLIVAEATLATTDAWRENQDENAEIIDGSKFEAWTSALLMKKPCL
ncbi:hypothetical protein F4825DRAFT_423333 [Nemania diffusa]|nr:hypothetical protein F4825DRAFT_423333 [Nemania diffusa]